MNPVVVTHRGMLMPGASRPASTRPSGPPATDSGVICSTIVPNAVPDMRASEIRTMSFTPARARLRGMGI